MSKIKAIFALYPQVATVRGDEAFDANDNKIEYDESAVQAEMNRTAYIENRAKEYPPIGDQLDALFHAGVFPPEMAAMIQAVKDKYPKE